MIEIPKKLQREEFRFIPILKDTKQPATKFKERGGYKYNDKELLHYIKISNSYGILGGYGNLIIIDINNINAQEEIGILNIPETLTGLSSTKKLKHLYFITEDRKRSSSYKNIADIRGYNNFAIGINSIINDKKYDMLLDKEISILTNENYNKITKLFSRLKINTSIESNTFSLKYSNPNSYYLDRRDFVYKPIKVELIDIFNHNGKRNYKIKLPNELGIKTIDLNSFHENKLEKIRLTTPYFYLSSENCYVNKQKALRWVVTPC